jgi:hypothetical protein
MRQCECAEIGDDREAARAVDLVDPDDVGAADVGTD